MWRRLDNSAKIFPLSTSKKYSTVFRLSVVLKENINPTVLKNALNEALEKYNLFKVRIKKGFFWHYLETNPKEPIIEEEKDYPCKYINPNSNNGYLFKVTYFQNKINIDVFHALTDGDSASVFFREMIYTYLEKMHPEELTNDNRMARKIEFNIEDSYMKNYDKNSKSSRKTEKAYKLKGGTIKLGGVSVIHQIINSEQLKGEMKKHNMTVTQYLTAVLLYSIYTENYTKNNGKRPVKICLPVNLKRFFPSKTLSNFFSYITLVAKMNDGNLDTFEKIVEFVKGEFDKQLTAEELRKTMSNNVRLGNNFFVRIVPLFLKIVLVRLAYMEIRKYTTITYSNMGRIGIIGDYQKYMDYFMVLIAPEPYERIKCSSCTFENKIVYTFTSVLDNNEIEKGFYNFLREKGIEVEIESNGVLDDISKEIK